MRCEANQLAKGNAEWPLIGRGLRSRTQPIRGVAACFHQWDRPHIARNGIGQISTRRNGGGIESVQLCLIDTMAANWAQLSN